jgi:hypothetical protein
MAKEEFGVVLAYREFCAEATASSIEQRYTLGRQFVASVADLMDSRQKAGKPIEFRAAFGIVRAAVEAESERIERETGEKPALPADMSRWCSYFHLRETCGKEIFNFPVRALNIFCKAVDNSNPENPVRASWVDHLTDLIKRNEKERLGMRAITNALVNAGLIDPPAPSGGAVEPQGETEDKGKGKGKGAKSPLLDLAARFEQIYENEVEFDGETARKNLAVLYGAIVALAVKRKIPLTATATAPEFDLTQPVASA